MGRQTLALRRLVLGGRSKSGTALSSGASHDALEEVCRAVADGGWRSVLGTVSRSTRTATSLQFPPETGNVCLVSSRSQTIIVGQMCGLTNFCFMCECNCSISKILPLMTSISWIWVATVPGLGIAPTATKQICQDILWCSYSFVRPPWASNSVRICSRSSWRREGGGGPAMPRCALYMVNMDEASCLCAGIEQWVVVVSCGEWAQCCGPAKRGLRDCYMAELCAAEEGDCANKGRCCDCASDHKGDRC